MGHLGRLNYVRLWSGLLVTGVVMAVLVMMLPGQAPWLAVAFGAVVTMLIGVVSRSMPDRLRGLARLLAASFGLGVLRILLQTVHSITISDSGFVQPSWGDAVYPFACAFAVILVLRLVRERSLGRDPDAWIDSLLITAALTVALWTTVISDYMGDSTAALSERLVNLMYFVVSLVVFAVALRVMAGPSARSRSYVLLLLALLTNLAVDLAVTLAQATGSSPTVLFFCTPLAFALGGAAVLHPSAAQLVERPDDFEPAVSIGRVVLLASAMLMPQAAVLVNFNKLTRLDLLVLGGATVVLGSLVMLRFLRLVRAREQLLASETSLRSVGARLLQNVTSAEVHHTVREEIPAVVSNTLTLSGVRIGADPVRLGSAYGRRLRADQYNARIVEILDSVGPAVEVCTPIKVGGERQMLFAVRATTSDNPAPLWLWTVSPQALGRHQRHSLRSLARECDLALRGVAAAEVRSKEESERRWKESIIRSERRFRALVQHSSDIVAVVDDGANLSYISPAVRSLLGYEPTSVTGQSWVEMVYPDDRDAAIRALAECRDGHQIARAEFRFIDTTGHPHMMEVAMANHSGTPDVEGVVLNARDVTVAREMEENLERAASHDAKTGLLNRDSLEEEILIATAEAQGAAHEAAVMVIHLEQFEMITDGLGFEGVDNVLSEVADRIRGAVRMVDLVGRIEGSQFAVLVRHTYGLHETEQLAQRVLTALTGSIEYERKSIPLDAYVGIALSGGQHGDDLLRLGHTALRAGMNNSERIQGFESPMVESVMEQLELRGRLEEAIDNNELFLMYQPLVSLDDGHIEGAEALVRWRHPERGVVGPIHFIPLAEETGLVLPLGEWVLREVCRQVAEWDGLGLLADDMLFSLNLSAVQLSDPTIITTIASALAQSGVNPKRLVAELTETFFMDTDDQKSADTLEHIRALGLQIAIDDFGTGYSSLDRITRFPVDIVKIDRAFVSPLDDGHVRDVDMLTRIIQIIEDLGAVSVAEGIETGSEAEVLRNLGCNKGQGYFFDRPMEAPSFVDRLVKQHDRDAATASGAGIGQPKKR